MIDSDHAESVVFWSRGSEPMADTAGAADRVKSKVAGSWLRLFRAYPSRSCTERNCPEWMPFDHIRLFRIANHGRTSCVLQDPQWSGDGEIICPVVHPWWPAGRLKFGDRECEALVVSNRFQARPLFRSDRRSNTPEGAPRTSSPESVC